MGPSRMLLRQAGDRGDRGPRGRRRARARAVVRPARRRGGRGARRVLPPVRRAADRRRHDPPAAPDRPVARARSDPDRAAPSTRDEALAIGLVNRVVPRGAGARCRRSSSRTELRELPQAAMRADRMSAYLQHDLDLDGRARKGARARLAALAEAAAGRREVRRRSRTARRARREARVVCGCCSRLLSDELHRAASRQRAAPDRHLRRRVRPLRRVQAGRAPEDRTRCQTECPDVFSDRDSLMAYESLSCENAVEYVDGTQPKAARKR